MRGPDGSNGASECKTSQAPAADSLRQSGREPSFDEATERRCVLTERADAIREERQFTDAMISEERQKADAIRSDYETLFRGLLEGAPDAIAVVDNDGSIVFVNKETTRIFGYAREELIGKQVELLVPEQLREAHAARRTRYIAAPTLRPMGMAMDLVARRKDGTNLPVEISLSPLQTDVGVLVTAIIRDVTVRRRAEAERAALLTREKVAREEAERATRIRDEFLAVVSHDLRNPLAAIVFDAGVLLMAAPEGSTGETVRKAAERISGTSHHMSVLIEDLLDVASIDAGRLKIEPTQADAAVLLNEAVEKFAPLGIEKGLWVKGTPDTEAIAYCDRDRVLQVLGNLVGNAVKFTPGGGTVTIRVESVGHEVRFSVSDTGPGISAEQQEHVFDRFWQANQGEKKALGLGLYISKGIVEAHGGRIWVESMVGAGSTFYFTLPSASDTLPTTETV